ncbi:MAG: hypothetical protein ACI88Z_001450, partial [Sphingobacteriales bacterium]
TSNKSWESAKLSVSTSPFMAIVVLSSRTVKIPNSGPVPFFYSL